MEEQEGESLGEVTKEVGQGCKAKVCLMSHLLQSLDTAPL